MENKSAALLTFARKSGATAATILRPDCVLVEDSLARCCKKPKCPFWGQSSSCPPHVGGPDDFRQLLQASRLVLVVRLDIQACSLHGEERAQVMRLLHELVAAVEIQAKQLGYAGASGFAAGSCKPCFCADKDDCSALHNKGKCRFPDQARPSLSGFGVNVGHLMEAAGWSGTLFSEREGAGQLAWVAGLIVLS